MKNQAEIYQALLDGKIVQQRNGMKIHLFNGNLYNTTGGRVSLTFDTSDIWHIYTEPTEYEVALYDVWNGSIWFRTEIYYKNDKSAIQSNSYSSQKYIPVVKRTNITQIVKTDD